MEKQTLEQLEALLNAVSKDLAPRVEGLAETIFESKVTVAQELPCLGVDPGTGWLSFRVAAPKGT